MKLKHYDHVAGARFITFCTHKKLPLLENDIFKQYIIDAIDKMRNETGFNLHGYVIMPEHIHLVILPKPDMKIGRVIGEIKRESAKRILADLKDITSPHLRELIAIRNRLERYVVWQRRCYDHNCRSEKRTWDAINYCHNNPVKRGLVDDPGKWLWSSYRNYLNVVDLKLEIDLLES